MKITSLKFAIRTKDFKQSKWFYTEVLGLKEVESWEEQTDCGCILKIGEGSFIEISSVFPKNENYKTEFATTFKSEKVDIQLAVENIDFWVQRLQENNWEMRGPVDRPWGATYLYLKDPDGVKIIIYEAS